MSQLLFEYKSAEELIQDDYHSINTLTNIINKIQGTIYPLELIEPVQIFNHILSTSPELCWFVVESNQIHGYVLTHSWPDNRYPPKLNSIEDICNKTSKHGLDKHITNIFLHDLTIIPEMTNRGIAKQLVARVLNHIYSWNRQVTISLVAVRNSTKFWEKNGFKSISPSELDFRQEEILKTYGDDTATIMTLDIIPSNK